MKKILLAGAGAILAVSGLSSFKSFHRRTGPYYFAVNPGVNKVSNNSAKFFKFEVTAIDYDPGTCFSGAGSGFDCIVTFTQHLNSNKTQLTQVATVSSTVQTKAASY